MANKCLRFGTLLLSFLACSARAEDFFFNSAGTRIHYTSDGRGVPVVLIHGLGASIATNWAQPGIINALADTYQVIAIDNRGHGQSDKPHDPQACGSKMVEDVIRLMDHLKIARAHVVGYSLGAMITSVLVAEHPNRLLTASLGGAARFYVRGRQGHREMIEALAESLEKGKGIVPLLADLGYSPEQVEPLNKVFLSMNDPLAVAAVVRGEMDFLPSLLLSEAQLRANKVPTLLLNGEFDPRKSDVDALAALMPSLKVVVIPGANHATAVRNAEFLTSLKAFLREHSRR
jgi:pimeloyl-ACP methyl ester carboxylesterase